MFTGLIEKVGTVSSVTESPAGRELCIDSDYADLSLGESIAINGACLTVREYRDGSFTVAAVATTLEWLQPATIVSAALAGGRQMGASTPDRRR